jgi:hypothetical protein
MGLIDSLEQDEFWFGQDARPYRIKDMEQRHRLNVLAMLRRRAESLYDHKQWLDFGDLRNAPDEVMDAYYAELPQDPLKWINSRPLVIAMEKAVRDYGTVDGEVIAEDQRELSS